MKLKKKYKLKKINVVLSISFLTILLGIVGLNYVYASLTDKDQATNDFQIGEVKGNITEKFDPPTKETPIKPGDTYPKEVKVSNTSSLPFFVRVLVTPEIQTSEGVLLASKIGKELSIDLGDDWLLGEDGYYYYLKEVLPGSDTSLLFTTVTLADNLGAEYGDASMSITIKSETVIASGDNYRSVYFGGSIPSTENLAQIDEVYQKIVVEGRN